MPMKTYITSLVKWGCIIYLTVFLPELFDFTSRTDLPEQKGSKRFFSTALILEHAEVLLHARDYSTDALIFFPLKIPLHKSKMVDISDMNGLLEKSFLHRVDLCYTASKYYLHGLPFNVAHT